MAHEAVSLRGAGPALLVGLLAAILFSILMLVSLFPDLARAQSGAEGDPGTAAAATGEVGRSLGISSVPNLRDLGGYRTGDGRVVRSGLVYRSDQLSGISADDMQKLAALGLVNVYDLRTDDEREAQPDELPQGAEYTQLDVLADASSAGPAQLEKLLHDPQKADAALGGGKVEAEFEKGYRQFVSLPSAREAYRRLFLALGEREELPALFHCTTGKDRTGWAAAALLTLLGVPEEQVMQDYLRSNEYILPAYAKKIDAFVAAGGDREIPEAILGVQRGYLEASFDEMKTRYGTIENYFAEGLGIDADRQEALKSLYLTRPRAASR